MPTCIITGATGYIGSNLTNFLLDQGYEIHVLVREQAGRYTNFSDKVRIWPYYGRSEDVSAVFKFLEREPLIVFHLAAKVSYENNLSVIDDLMKANIILGSQVLESMQAYGCEFLINTGTFWQYDHKNYLQPNSLYAASKEAFQVLIDYYCNNFSIKAITLILMDVYGPNDTRGKLFNQLQEHASNGIPIKLTKCKQKVNLVHIDDVTSAYNQAAELLKEKTKGHYKYFVANENTHVLKDVINLYQNKISTQIQINWGAKPYREREIMYPYIGDHLPNWKAKIDIEQGLESIIR